MNCQRSILSHNRNIDIEVPSPGSHPEYYPVFRYDNINGIVCLIMVCEPGEYGPYELPVVKEPLEFQDGLAYLVKTDILAGILYFSYEKNSLSNIFPLMPDKVRKIQSMNRKGVKPETLSSFMSNDSDKDDETGFISAAGDESITRFDERKRKSKRHKGRRNNGGRKEKGKEQ